MQSISKRKTPTHYRVRRPGRTGGWLPLNGVSPDRVRAIFAHTKYTLEFW